RGRGRLRPAQAGRRCRGLPAAGARRRPGDERDPLRVPGRRRRVPVGVGERARARGARGGRRGRARHEGLAPRRDRGGHSGRGGGGGGMRLDARNTAIVLDSTADFPEGPERFPNWRIVPLYVRFGDESYRDYVELSPAEFYRRLRAAPAAPSTS